MRLAIPHNVVQLAWAVLEDKDATEREVKLAEAILPHVKALAQLHDATVAFMRVLEPCVVETSPFDAYPALATNEEQQRMAQIAKYLTAWEEKFRADGIDTRQLVERGPIVKTVLELVDGNGIDLVAMTSHGRTGLSRVFYGSIAAGILQGTKQPLLLVRSE